MDLQFTPEEIAFRDAVRDFIAAEYPEQLKGRRRGDADLTKQDYLSWHKVLAKKGWGKKILVFKKKRRKGYKLMKGHRQLFTALEIKEISL